jgi:hypothetical protein
MSHLKQFLTRCYLMYMLYFYGALEHYSGAMTRAAAGSRQSGPPRGARGGRAAGRGLATSATRGAGAADAGLRARGGAASDLSRARSRQPTLRTDTTGGESARGALRR